jgi:hypothetical protein
MISTIEEQVTGRRRPDGTPNIRTVTRTLIEGAVTEILTLTGGWQQPYPSQKTDLVPVYVIDAGQTVRVANLHLPVTPTVGDRVRIVADHVYADRDDYTARTLDVL